MEALVTDASGPRTCARILIVDDERALVGVLAMLLGDAGYEFVTAYDGATALRRIRDDPPDLVLLGLGLPRLSGDELARTIVERALAPLIILDGRSPARSHVFSISVPTTTYRSPSRPRNCWRRSARHSGARSACTEPGTSAGWR